jgi:hypothetical protein
VLGLLYLFLFPQPSGKEGYFKAVWSLAVPERPGPPAPAAAGAAGGSRQSWFRAGRYFGYVRLDGRLLYAAEVLHGVALSELGFINYPQVADNFVFQDTAGRFQYGVRGYGYPVLDPSGERLYAVSTDLSGLKRLDRDGEVLWSAGFFSPITSLALSEDQCAVGLLDGTLKLLDSGGRVAQDFHPEPSRIPVILGAALSPERLAVLSGIDPQRLTILERRGAEYAPLESLATGSDLRRPATLGFTADGRFLAYETDSGLALRDLRRRASSVLPGRLLALSSSGEGLLAVGSRAEGTVSRAEGTVSRAEDTESRAGGAIGGEESACRLRLLRPPASPLYEQRLPVGDLFLRFLDGVLLLGIPGRLLRVDYLEG